MKRSSSSRCELHGVTHLLQPANEASGGLVGVRAVEVAEAIYRSTLESRVIHLTPDAPGERSR